MAGKYNATKVKLTIGVDPVAPATTITQWKGLSEETSCSFDVSIDSIDTTTKYNDGFKDSIPGLITGSISGEAKVNNAASANLYSSGDILTMALARTKKTFRMGSGDDDEPTEQFIGYFTKFNKKLDMESAGVYSFEIAMTTRPAIVNS